MYKIEAGNSSKTVMSNSEENAIKLIDFNDVNTPSKNHFISTLLPFENSNQSHQLNHNCDCYKPDINLNKHSKTSDLLHIDHPSLNGNKGLVTFLMNCERCNKSACVTSADLNSPDDKIISMLKSAYKNKKIISVKLKQYNDMFSDEYVNIKNAEFDLEVKKKKVKPAKIKAEKISLINRRHKILSTSKNFVVVSSSIASAIKTGIARGKIKTENDVRGVFAQPYAGQIDAVNMNHKCECQRPTPNLKQRNKNLELVHIDHPSINGKPAIIVYVSKCASCEESACITSRDFNYFGDKIPLMIKAAYMDKKDS